MSLTTMGMVEVAKVYADGGVVNVNPSRIGGTWAYVLVNGEGRTVREASGSITPAEVGLAKVSNNLTELLAVLMGLEQMPDGWAGTLYTDSFVTLCRIRGGKKFAGIPESMRERTRVVRERLGAFFSVLLGGHPNKAELLLGKRKDGMPVSGYNVRCDGLCKAEAELLRQKVTPYAEGIFTAPGV